jgi:cytochrome oxidase Cu insertion factor (SCO1/SenC/PrrC family)
MRRLTAIAVAAAAVVGVAVGVLLHDTFAAKRAAAQTRPRLPALYGVATWKRGVAAAPAFTLLDQRGRTVGLASYRGRPVVVAFMDSLCKGACPLESAELSAALRPLPDAVRPQLLIVSVDLADTPRSIARAARKWHLPSGFEWLRGTRRELARVWRDYHIAVKVTKGDIAHSDAFYLVDRNGDERAGFLTPFSPRLLTHDLLRLASET